ncbi:MAG: glycosyltransferase [Bacteroidales bacterium]|nr:MAG: glycosyltransferase [Bacteroidales bacterium]
MKLSVVIVNYNVKYFLEQCLIAVLKAGKGIDMEVFVVDNASADGSCQMVKQRFPNIHLIENVENVGFSVANNQAIKIAKGQYVLLLNPDTLVEEDTFSKCIDFMDNHPEAGSLTVKMIDGKGRYLPESKRGLPSPMVSFYKIFGFTKLFPRSKTFARYYLGHLDENTTHKIEILPGAFMLIPKAVFEKVGLLDESFFMYGEDIDLSYRILKADYDNYYFPETRIIHYKGESTKKGSINYVLLFYKAMAQFAKKHFTQKNARLYMLVVFLAIYFRAFLSILKRIVSSIFLPVCDILFIALGFLIIVPAWENFRFHSTNSYPDNLVLAMIPTYTIVWLISNWLSGAYDRPQKLFASAKGVLWGTLVILAIYALLPLDFRFSRAIILFGALWTLFTTQGVRILAGVFNKGLFPALQKKKRNAIVGLSSEADRVIEILNSSNADYQYFGLISPQPKLTHDSQLAGINQLEEFVRVNDINEVIFCSSNISSQEIIRNMLILSSHGVDYRIAPPESLAIIGSNSINAFSELYTPLMNAINTPRSRRNKRFFDIGVSLIILLTTPIWFFINKKTFSLLSNALSVLFGHKTWVGYDLKDSDLSTLPRIKKSVFTIQHMKNKQTERSSGINLIYAKNYSLLNDFSIVWQRIFSSSSIS